MAIVLGSSDSTNFTDSYSFNEGANNDVLFLSEEETAATSDLVTGIALNISAWSGITDMRVDLYEDNVRVASCNLSSAADTGDKVYPLDAAHQTTIGSVYRIGVVPDGVNPNNVTLAVDNNTGKYIYRMITSDPYGAPVSNLSGVGYFSNSEIYWGLDDTASDSITPPDPITDAQTGIALNGSGFPSGAINDVTVGGVSATTNGTTFDNVDIAAIVDENGVAIPDIGSSVDVIATNAAAETATASVTLNPKSGWAVTTLGTIDTVTTNSLYNLLLSQHSLTIATGDKFYFPNADGSTISDDSNFSFATYPKAFVYRDASSGLGYSVTLATSAGGTLALKRLAPFSFSTKIGF